MTDLPAIPLSDEVVDQIAAEIGIQVAYHIETMYPDAAKAVAWKSASRSIQGVVRNAVAAAGRAAEKGEADEWIRRKRLHRRRLNAIRRQGDINEDCRRAAEARPEGDPE